MSASGWTQTPIIISIEITADSAPPFINGGWSSEAVKEEIYFQAVGQKPTAVENFLNLDQGDVIFIFYSIRPQRIYQMV